jgi:hypothetical protein
MQCAVRSPGGPSLNEAFLLVKYDLNMISYNVHEDVEQFESNMQRKVSPAQTQHVIWMTV